MKSRTCFASSSRLKKDGRAILFISHKFDEIFRIADRWTCLRDGEYVGDGTIAETTERQLVSLMVGRSIDQVFPKEQVALGQDRARGRRSVASDRVRRGQLFSSPGRDPRLYGLVGAGRSETMQCLFGLTRSSRGEVRIDGKKAEITSPAQAVAAGIAYVPEDRQIAGRHSAVRRPRKYDARLARRYTTSGVLSTARELGETRRLGERLAVKASNWEQLVGQLSGGNQQKVVIGKWLATHPRILILDEPTKGIDIGSKAAVHEFMSELAGEGLAIILVSSELPEVMGMSDSILVMREGRLSRGLRTARRPPKPSSAQRRDWLRRPQHESSTARSYWPPSFWRSSPPSEYARPRL